MKEIKKMVEQVTGYEAADGTFFKTKEQCEAYEYTAKCVTKSLALKHRIAVTSQGWFFGNGDEDCDVEIFKIDDIDVLKIVNQYINSQCYDKSANVLIDDSYIGKIVAIGWSYDHDYAWKIGTFEEHIAEITKRYERAIAPKEGSDADES